MRFIALFPQNASKTTKDNHSNETVIFVIFGNVLKSNDIIQVVKTKIYKASSVCIHVESIDKVNSTTELL